MKFFKMIGEHLTQKPALRGKRLPTMYPSAASCRDDRTVHDESISGESDNGVFGACMRASWYRVVGYSESNPSTEYSEYIFAAGNMWEEWLIERTKQMGIYVANSLKWAISEYYLSGEIDIAVKDPETGETIIIESKTYSSANYQAKASYLGLAGRTPMPKVQNAMQAALYLYYFGKPENGGVKRVLLTYFDRACGGPECHQEFWITLRPVNGVHRIHVECTNDKGRHYSYDLDGISIEGVLARYKELIDYLVKDKENPPPPDYQHTYSDSKVIKLYDAGLISKTKYENWTKNKDKYPIGDWQCSYCGYNSICKQQKEAQGYA